MISVERSARGVGWMWAGKGVEIHAVPPTGRRRILEGQAKNSFGRAYRSVKRCRSGRTTGAEVFYPDSVQQPLGSDAGGDGA